MQFGSVQLFEIAQLKVVIFMKEKLNEEGKGNILIFRKKIFEVELLF
jgi:hypothetical protein